MTADGASHRRLGPGISPNALLLVASTGYVTLPSSSVMRAHIRTDATPREHVARKRNAELHTRRNMQRPSLVRLAGALLLCLPPIVHSQETPVTVAGEQYALLTRRTAANFDLSLTVTPAPGSEEGLVRLLFGYQDERNCYRLSIRQNQCEIQKLSGGEGASLCASSAEMALQSPYRVRIKRRTSTLTVAVNGRVMCESPDTTFSRGGTAVCITPERPKTEDVSLQKVAPIHIADDFMVEVDQSIVEATVEKRTAAIPDADLKSVRQWEFVSGSWQLHSVMEDVLEVDDPLLQQRIAASQSKPDALRSSNPFCMQATSDGPDIATIGHPFWDDYTAAVSVNSSGTVFGLVFYYRDLQDYFMLRWRCLTVEEKPEPIELVRVTAEGADVLASAVALGRTNQWFRLGVRVSGRHVRGYLDGVRLFDVFSDELTGGEVGLYSCGKSGTFFDDVTIDTTDSFPLDVPGLLKPACDPIASGWQVAEDSAGHAFLAAQSAKPDLCRLGPSFASGMALTTWLQLPAAPAGAREARTIRLQFGGPSGTVVYELSEQPGDTVAVTHRLTHEHGGQRQTLAEASGPSWAPGDKQLELDLTEPALAKVYISGTLELRGRLAEPVIGGFSVAATNAKAARLAHLRIDSTRAEDCERPPTNVVFADDPYMLHWSAPQGAWVPGGNMRTFWHKGDFFGRFSVKMPFMDGAQLLFCTDRSQPASDPAAPLEPQRGYLISFDASGKAVRFDRQGKQVQRIAVDPANPVSISRDGKYVWLSTDEKELFCYRDQTPPSGTKLALQTKHDLAAEDFGRIEVTRAQVRDDYFDCAPSDWMRIGQWEVTNRFTCDPRWSHLAGSSARAGAILWSKTAYEGDLTIEFYAGHNMRRFDDWASPLYYPRTGDINVTICADGQDLDSGYSVTLSGWDSTWSETWTRLWRKDKSVAESDRELVPRNRELYPSKRIIPVPWISKGRAIHGAWYYIKLRKVGNRVEYYFDNELVLSYEDSKPLTGQRIALWTYDNSVMFSRAKISYTRRRLASLVVPQEQLRSTRQNVESASVETETARGVARLVSPTHPGLMFSFESGVEGWSNVGGEQGALLNVDRESAAAGEGSLQLLNIETGGCFGARVPVQGLRAAGTKLEFDYRLTAQAKVNLYLKLDEPYDRWYFIQFTGEKGESVRNIQLGSIAKVQRNGRWRTASFNLGDALGALRPEDPDLRLEEIRIGNFHEGYLGVGIGGNPKGCSLNVDNFRIFTPASGPVRVQLRAPDGGTAAEMFSLSRQAACRRPGAKDTVSADGVFADVQPGTWYAHAWSPGADAGQELIASLPIEVSDSVLAVKSVKPDPETAWGGAPVYIDLSPATGPNLDVASVWFSLNGALVPGRSEAVSYSHAKRRLTLDVRLAPVTFADQAPVNIELYARDTSGKPMTHSWSYQMSGANDRHPPQVLGLTNYPLHNTFDHSIAPCVSPWGRGGSLLTLDAQDGVSGRGCLRGTNVTLGGPSGVALYPRAFNAGKYPILAFDYRIPKTYHLDIVLDPGGVWRHIRLSDVDRANKPLGEVPDATADGAWHHAELNLPSLLAEQPRSARMFELSQLLLIDTGYQGTGPNMTFSLDNLQLVPAVSGAQGIALKWEACDPSGIKEFRYRWHSRPILSPYTTIPGNETGKTFYVEEEGQLYFHFQAIDNNGRASPTLHYRFLVDNTPPLCGPPVPPPGTRAGDGSVTIPVSDSGAGVDVGSILLRVNGRAYRIDSPALDYDQKKGELAWDWAADPTAEPFAEGSEVSCSLDSVCDYAGNRGPRMSWEWTVDGQRDRTPPTPPVVSCPSHKVLLFETYEEAEEGWLLRTFDLYTTSVARMPRDRNSDNHCLRIYDYRRYESLAVVRTQPYELYEYPVVAFEYRLQEGMDIDWVFQIDGKPYRVRMAATGPGPDTIGQMPGIVADSAWHAAWFDLGALIRKQLPEAETPTVEMISLGTFNLETQTTRKYLFLDNFMICAPGSERPVFELASRDAAGVAGFTYELDQRIDTEPSRSASVIESPKLEVGSLEPGLWHMHCRAQNGAGLWSQSTHYPYFVGEQTQ